jgi:dienelactone hydrolase
MKKTAVKLKHTDFNMKEHGFVGHLAEPEQTNGKAVIVIMGEEQSFLPGIKIAERFADYGFTGLAVSLFGAEGLPDTPDRCPLEMKGFKILQNRKRFAQSYGHVACVL